MKINMRIGLHHEARVGEPLLPVQVLLSFGSSGFGRGVETDTVVNHLRPTFGVGLGGQGGRGRVFGRHLPLLLPLFLELLVFLGVLQFQFQPSGRTPNHDDGTKINFFE